MLRLSAWMSVVPRNLCPWELLAAKPKRHVLVLLFLFLVGCSPSGEALPPLVGGTRVLIGF